MKIRAGSFLLEVASGAGLALVAYSLIARAPRGDAPRGTPVLSVAPSVVLKLFLSERGGSTLYTLAPDQRTVYYYAHLDRYAEGIVDGKQLRGGEVLGYVGDSGNANPGDYHLHFEISTTTDPKRHWGGMPVNPYPLLRAGVYAP